MLSTRYSTYAVFRSEPLAAVGWLSFLLWLDVNGNISVSHQLQT